MTFRVVTVEPSSPTETATSSGFTREDAALDFACDVLGADVEVLRIEDAAGVVVKDAEAVRAWCAARKRSTPR